MTYGALHLNWTQAALTAGIFVVFGSPVARRFGVARFALLLLCSLAIGALVHWLLLANGSVPLVGFGGAVNACPGAAARFALTGDEFDWPEAHTAPALTLVETLTTPTTLVFAALTIGSAWLLSPGLDGGASVAWVPVAVCFAFGLGTFAAFDPPSE